MEFPPPFKGEGQGEGLKEYNPHPTLSLQRERVFLRDILTSLCVRVFLRPVPFPIDFYKK